MTTDIREVYWPGKIAVANDHGHFPGCHAKDFDSAEEMNKFFGEDGKRYLVVQLLPTNGGITALYTNRLDPEEQEELDMVSREMTNKMDELRAKRAEAKAKAQEAKDNAERELSRLAKIGAMYEDRQAALKKLPDGKEKKKQLELLFDGKDADMQAVVEGKDVVENGGQ